MFMCNFADEEDIPRENASVYYKCSLHWLAESSPLGHTQVGSAKCQG